MSTKSTLFYGSNKENKYSTDHNLEIHIYKDIHEPAETVVVDLMCSVCNCDYQFLMSKHLGIQLADMLKKSQGDQN